MHALRQRTPEPWMAEAGLLRFLYIRAQRVLDLIALLGQNAHLIGIVLPTQGHPSIANRRIETDSAGAAATVPLETGQQIPEIPTLIP